MGTTSAASAANAAHQSHDGAPDLVRLVSQDGFVFVLDRKAAVEATTIRTMLSAQLGFSESTSNEVRFEDIRGVVLDKVCQYLCYKLKHEATSSLDVPEFPIAPEIAIELLLAADYLQC